MHHSQGTFVAIMQLFFRNTNRITWLESKFAGLKFGEPFYAALLAADIKFTKIYFPDLWQFDTVQLELSIWPLLAIWLTLLSSNSTCRIFSVWNVVKQKQTVSVHDHLSVCKGIYQITASKLIRVFQPMLWHKHMDGFVVWTHDVGGFDLFKVIY